MQINRLHTQWPYSEARAPLTCTDCLCQCCECKREQRSNMNWDNETVLQFLELYQIHSCIWDPQHESHKNRQRVNDAWNDIKEKLGVACTVKDLKKKKESLMSAYRHYKTKIKKSERSGSGSSDIYQPTWFAFSLMDGFLGSIYTCNATQSTEFYNVPVLPNTTSHIPENTSQTMSVANRNISRQPKTITVPTKSNPLYVTKVEGKVAHPSSNGEKTEKSDMDEYELYGQLLAKKLRKLDEHQRDVAMHEIDNIMFRAKMQSSNTQSRSYSTSPVPRIAKSPIFIVAQPSHQQYEDENTPYQEHMQPHPPS